MGRKNRSNHKKVACKKVRVTSDTFRKSLSPHLPTIDQKTRRRRDDGRVWGEIHKANRERILSRNIGRTEPDRSTDYRSSWGTGSFHTKIHVVARCSHFSSISILDFLLQHLSNAKEALDNGRHHVSCRTVLPGNFSSAIIRRLTIVINLGYA